MSRFIRKVKNYICNQNRILLQFGGKQLKTFEIEYNKKINLKFKMIETNKDELEIFISNEIDVDKITTSSSCLTIINKKH
ncbi:hypothetical protein crov024 [Cafeteria roenbergensis virus]|uniref:Uncharacterized protein n=1 Tax=Cafeteria roenbergensis virus (strain BV-PW1) TaxID=693272 RepID=E3T4E4_CROVB|nr:hypothetical protein crov024 [Cafeteria roenbergensis virus BV-PW1]ADO67057.1 hypothetical protein crov024 [Cafeteria roenbergensis virus BV-PW1]